MPHASAQEMTETELWVEIIGLGEAQGGTFDYDEMTFEKIEVARPNVDA